MSFFDLDLPEEIVACALAQGWQQPTAVQTVVIPKALEGHDIFGGAPTGTGKSAAFLLPACLAISPKFTNFTANEGGRCIPSQCHCKAVITAFYYAADFVHGPSLRLYNIMSVYPAL